MSEIVKQAISLCKKKKTEHRNTVAAIVGIAAEEFFIFEATRGT